MFSRLQRFYNSIKLAADLLMITAAFGAAYWTRFYSGLPHESIPGPDDSLITLGLAVVIFPIVFRQTNLYTSNRARTHLGEVFEIFKAMVLAALILIAVVNFVRDRYSRLTLVIFFGYAFLFISAVRVMTRSAFNKLRRRGYNLKTILVVGAGELGHRVCDTIEQHKELGFKVSGLLTRHPEKVGTTYKKAPVVGVVGDVEKVLDDTKPDQVIIALPIEEGHVVKELMEKLALRTVDVKVVPDLYQYRTLRGGLEEFGGLPILSLQGDPLHGWNVVLKRVFDLAISTVTLLLASPVMVFVALAVKFSSKGPVFFRQERMGMDGRTFAMLKFRTMKLDAEAAGAQMTSPDDPRRTAMGGFLRRTSIDELPQLLNVLKGEMSLVGPRPERPVFIEEFKKQIPRYHLRHLVKSGMTGWAQINGLRGQTSIEKRIEFDLYYIENWSLLLDVKILARTALGGFLSKNAY
ncbi:MAG: undecaprenyl-phosphate glucose phosphotransferase [Myxococcaceae bacterium]